MGYICEFRVWSNLYLTCCVVINIVLYWAAEYRESTVLSWQYACMPGQWRSLRQFVLFSYLPMYFLQNYQNTVLWHMSLPWRHNGRDGVSNHQPHDCLLNRLCGRRSKKTSKLRVTGHCAGNSPGTDEFTAQMTSNAENVSIWWRHHVTPI